MSVRDHKMLFSVLVGAALTGAGALLPVTAAQGAAAALTIGVDHAPPSGHNFEYVDYFPRSGAKVHTGDVVAFAWGATPDGFHTATLLKSGQTPQDAWQSTPVAVPDSDDGSGALQFNPAIGGPTFPPPGSGAPNACGDASTPCEYDGSGTVNSGARPTDGATSFSVKINAPEGTTLNFVCLVHPGMQGSLQVVPAGTAASTSTEVSDAAAAQASQDDSDALAAEAAAGPATSTVDSAGHRTYTATAGTATPYVEVAEFLRGPLTIGTGDRIIWKTKTIKDIHTVTFPTGTHAADPIPAFCEGSGTADAPATGPPPSCAGGPANFEVHFVPGPFGVSAITSPTQVSSSGLLAAPPAPFPSQTTFTFPTAGSYRFFCHIHENAMKGAVNVKAPTPTSLSIAIKTANGTSTVADPVTGVLGASGTRLAGQVVRLVGRVGGSTTYKTLGYARTTASGRVTFNVKPPRGRDVYALVYNGSRPTRPAYLGSHSPTVTVTVLR